ncbi:metal ABC transporter solute-binding protein, Zn/Mn family [Microbacterium xanthum]|uniref:metal ABC transporter solute-binding protein, Zn/Mn family n=1 Tax=Microbacterium xanthum TaxID=3079794 RepID=UPI002AD4B48C|nr:zinc ABC transporter substrate-binding protein [Microbacterium sp. KSW-48]MDZ8173036.1 zinc ABC transporter substrate-binding protein [Microbacterium sp. KSW-48]
MRAPRMLPVIGITAGSALVLAGCGASSDDDAGASEDTITVVASTNVYGQIAEQIGGDAVTVTSIIDSAAQDPHEYEGSAQDQLLVSNADIVIENGGGYDGFIDAMLESSDADAHVITAVEFSHDYPGDDDHDEEEHSDEDEHDHAEDEEEHAEDEEHSDEEEHDHEEEHSEEEHDHAEHEEEHSDEEEHDHEGHDHIEGFNEHVWYDPHTIEHVAEAIADELSELDPDQAETFEANLAEFTEGVEAIEADLDAVASTHEGDEIFVTEPVPLYLSSAAGLVNVAPDAFTEAVEEGQDVAPATLLESITLLESGDVRLVIVNAQTGGAETTQIIEEADALGIPVIEFAETLPEGETYVSWMQANVAAMADALAE